jgi:hypothetical protein
MAIFTGMAHFKWMELRSSEIFMECTYLYFDKLNHVYGLSLTSALLTGMGLLNVPGRAAFYMTINRYLATML